MNEETQVKNELAKNILDWILVILFAMVFAFLFSRFVIVNASVPTSSMEGTIRGGDRIIAFRLAYILSEPDTYDIIIFRGPDDDTTLYVKRIIGVGGDVVNIVDGQVFINGSEEPQRDDFVFSESGCNFGPFYVPEGYFFVLGDNRGNSVDSRRWENIYVRRNQILGRVIFRYFPGFQNLANT